MYMMIWMRAEGRSPSSSSSSGGEGTIELWEVDDRMPGLAVVFLLSLSVSLSKLTTSYSVSELLFLSLFSIWEQGEVTVKYRATYFECECCLKSENVTLWPTHEDFEAQIFGYLANQSVEKIGPALSSSSPVWVWDRRTRCNCVCWRARRAYRWASTLEPESPAGTAQALPPLWSPGPPPSSCTWTYLCVIQVKE